MRLFKKKPGSAAPPERRTVWQTVAARSGGEFREGKRAVDDRVVLRDGPREVHLDTYVQQQGQVAVTYTRVRAYFLGWRELKLLVRRRNFLDRMVEGLGFGRRLPLNRALMERYVVKGRPPSRIPSLFAGSHVTEAVLRVPSLRLEIRRAERKARKKFGASAGVVVCLGTGVILDPDRLLAMMEVVQEALEGLQRVGEASDDPLPDGNPRS